MVCNASNQHEKNPFHVAHHYGSGSVPSPSFLVNEHFGTRFFLPLPLPPKDIQSIVISELNLFTIFIVVLVSIGDTARLDATLNHRVDGPCSRQLASDSVPVPDMLEAIWYPFATFRMKSVALSAPFLLLKRSPA